MDLPHGGVTRYEVQGFGDVGWEGFRHGRWYAEQQCLGEFLDVLRCQPKLFHLFRSDVIGLHTHLRELQVGCLVDVGMGKLEPSRIYGGLAENDVFFIDLVLVVHILRPVEPDDVRNAVPVGEMGDNPFLPCPHGIFLETQDMALDLYESHVRRQLCDGIHLTAVYIFVRIIFQQVAPCLDVKLLAQQLLSFGTHARKVHNVLFENAAHPF